MTTTQATIRDAFVSTKHVLASQWDEAATRTSGEPTAILKDLACQRAWWADANSDEPAVTSYHRKLVDHLLEKNALDQLERSLTLGRFLIREELGRGGMGVVYLGWDPDTKRLVALKRVRGHGKQARTRFQREARVLARLDHSAIAQFLDVEQIGSADVLVMEYVSGMSASRYVRKMTKSGRSIPWSMAVSWASQILEALAHAHGRQVIHRDIKPGNVMIQDGPGSPVKLLDLGLAKCLDEQQPDHQLTQDGQALGTREYMPPEQWVNGASVSAAADLYALGGTLYYLLAGRPPFEADTSYRIMNLHLTAPVPSIRLVRPDVPEALDAVIQRMLAKNPAHRGTARELAWQLSRVQATARSPEGRPSMPPTPTPTPTPNPNPNEMASRSSFSVRPVGETKAQAAQSTLTGSRVGPLLREMGFEVTRFFGQKTASVLDAPPTERLMALSGELRRTLWDGLRGRRPDARQAAWATLLGTATMVAGLVWLMR